MHFNWMGQFWVFHIRVCGLCWSFSVPWNLVCFLTVRVQPPNSKLEPLASVAIFLVTIRDRILGFSREHMIPAQFAPEIPPLWGGRTQSPGVWVAPSLCCEPTATFFWWLLYPIYAIIECNPVLTNLPLSPTFSSSVEPNLYLVNTVTSIEFFIQTALARLWAGGQKKANPSALSTERCRPAKGGGPACAPSASRHPSSSGPRIWRGFQGTYGMPPADTLTDSFIHGWESCIYTLGPL